MAGSVTRLVSGVFVLLTRATFGAQRKQHFFSVKLFFDKFYGVAIFFNTIENFLSIDFL